MLGCVANKSSGDLRYIYNAKWYSYDDKVKAKWFRFALVKDDNTVEKDFNKLSAAEGDMHIMTKSNIKFGIDDVVMFGGQRYNITFIDGNRKEQGELAFINVKFNGNVPIYLTLRKAG